MRIATWNVNGIRARQHEVRAWIERDCPDVVCLQELKAEVNQIPEVVQLPDYHVFWHGRKGYSGVSLHVRKELLPTAPPFTHPDFDVESRVVTAGWEQMVIASVYVPNGGKDFAAKIDFIKRMTAWVRRL